MNVLLLNVFKKYFYVEIFFCKCCITCTSKLFTFDMSSLGTHKSDAYVKKNDRYVDCLQN